MTTRAPGAGRKPQPTALKLLRGNPGQRPINDAEPQFTVRLPTPPTQLSESAKSIWRREGRRLVQAGVFTVADAAAFAAWCQSYARWLEMVEMLNRTGPILRIDESPGFKINPLVAAVRDAQADFIRAGVEFGLTPSSRTRVKTMMQTKPSSDGEWWEASG